MEMIMSFRSVNEIDKFSFEDCVLTKIVQESTGLCLELEALIVRPTNSQNTNYTESYAGPTSAHLTDCRILAAVKEGYRYLDANDNPVEEIPDCALSEEETAALLKRAPGCYLFAMDPVEEKEGVSTYQLALEFPNDDVYDTTATETYRLTVSFTKAEFTWQFYMNRVQR